MKVSFLISASAFNRLQAAALARGWASDPEYADRTVQRFLVRAPASLARDALCSLAAMSGEFQVGDIQDITCAIGRFFGEGPRRLEIAGAEYTVGREARPLRSPPA